MMREGRPIGIKIVEVCILLRGVVAARDQETEPVTTTVRRGVRVRPNRSVPNWGSQLAVPVPVPCGGG
jgi:hypothetical protein